LRGPASLRSTIPVPLDEGRAAVDAYIYLQGMSAESMTALLSALREDVVLSDEDRAKGAIRAVGSITGEYDAIVFAEGDSLEALQRVALQRLRGGAAIPVTETYLALEVSSTSSPCTPGPGQKAAPDAPKRRTPPLAFGALVNLQVETGWARWVYWDLFCHLPGNPVGPGLQGEALTTGPWDLLVEVGANTLADLSGFVADVRGWAHVIGSSAAAMTLLVP
jgi:hypothetical protein